jgi:hypothetical protein
MFAVSSFKEYAHAGDYFRCNSIHWRPSRQLSAAGLAEPRLAKQQRLLGHEKQYSNMAALFSEISDAASRRLTAMHRLVDALSFDDIGRIEKRVEDYDKALKSWNEKLGGIYVRLTSLLSQSQSTRLEREVHNEFVRTGAKIEVLIRQKLAGATIEGGKRGTLKSELNHIQGLLRNFNRDFLDLLAVEHSRIFYGRYIEFGPDNLDDFSTWELFQALFKDRVQSPRVFRAPLHLPPPTIDRG